MTNLDPIERMNLAENNFLEGYNCSQSIVLAFSDIVNIDKDMLSTLASPFGGGMSRLRETCGALSGAFMILGLIYGYSTPDTKEKKKELYTLCQEYAKTFKEKNGFLRCHQLLGLPEGANEPTPSERTNDFYKKRPCKDIIGNAAYLLADFINKH